MTKDFDKSKKSVLQKWRPIEYQLSQARAHSVMYCEFCRSSNHNCSNCVAYVYCGEDDNTLFKRFIKSLNETNSLATELISVITKIEEKDEQESSR